MRPAAQTFTIRQAEAEVQLSTHICAANRPKDIVRAAIHAAAVTVIVCHPGHRLHPEVVLPIAQAEVTVLAATVVAIPREVHRRTAPVVRHTAPAAVLHSVQAAHPILAAVLREQAVAAPAAVVNI